MADYFVVYKMKIKKALTGLWDAHPRAVLIGCCVALFILGLMI